MRERDIPHSPDPDELVPLHTDDSGPASNAEQVLTPAPGQGEHGDATPGGEADPGAAERAADDAEERSIGRG